ncbi:MAG: 3-dehydroquinate synthase [Candidatus Sumerlaeia bacterium]
MTDPVIDRTIEVDLGERSYPIYIGAGGLGRTGEFVRRHCAAERALVVSNTTVGPLYSGCVMDALRAADVAADLLILPDGEKYKTLDTLNQIFDFLLERGYPRRSVLLALGGGVIGDVVGFAAAAYMRGVEFVQLPTSLLAMVDSSVGGKTGVNHRLGKNMIGAFYQPRFVLTDTRVLGTLAESEFRAGFAEVIKYAVIRDAAFFDFLEERSAALFAQESAPLAEMIARCCRIKAQVVEEDERESGLRAILNFGHTIGHAIETLAGYEGIKHGEAVAIGMSAACRIAEGMGLMCADAADRVRGLIAGVGLPCRQSLGLDTQALVECLFKDKKVRSGRLRFVLPVEIGRVVIRDDVPLDLVRAAIDEARA